jgi:hypothetical protein
LRSFDQDPRLMLGPYTDKEHLMTSPRSSHLSPRRLRARVALPLLLAAAALLVAGTPAQARRKDRLPPTFEGLKSATTCIPGPIGPETKASYHLSWNAAKDDVTPSSEIIYEVYQATASGGENFSQPTYTTTPGATSFNTPQLPARQAFYFVVRARDQAGKEDSNTVERQGQNLCV